MVAGKVGGEQQGDKGDRDVLLQDYGGNHISLGTYFAFEDKISHIQEVTQNLTIVDITSFKSFTSTTKQI